MRKPDPTSFTTAVYQAVVKLGKTNAAQVLAEVKHLIPNNLAAHAGKKILETESKQYNHIAGGMKRKLTNPIYTTERLVEIGRKCKVYNTLRILYKRKLIVRVSRGVYSPTQNTPTPRTTSNDSIRQRLLEELAKLGKAQISELAKILSDCIPEDKALKYANIFLKSEHKRKRSTDLNKINKERKLYVGKYVVTKNFVRDLLANKKIKKLSKGLYASLEHTEETT